MGSSIREPDCWSNFFSVDKKEAAAYSSSDRTIFWYHGLISSINSLYITKQDASDDSILHVEIICQSKIR